jgi:ATP-dependent Clp protease protease subunit
MTNPPPTLEIYALFCGTIDTTAVQRVFGGLGAAMSNNIKHIHLLFQSTGGYVGDSVCLYNTFKALPIDLTLYNVGSIASGAVIAYLGAKKRKTSARATFMIHRTSNSPQLANAARLQSVAESVILDDKRTESILREHINMPSEKWSALENELYFSGEEAVKIGLAHEVAEFSPPPGTQIFNL